MTKVLHYWHHYHHHIVTLLLTVLLAACSAGGGETGTGFNGKEQITQGVISGFGSVIINGVHYNTDNATVLFDDVESTEANLQVGMLVTLHGEVNVANNNGVATTIKFERDIEGEVIDNNFFVDESLNIMGQTVFVNNETIFDSKVVAITAMGEIAAGNFVEVSGFSDGSGQIFATRLEVKAASREAETVELQGLITERVNSTFTLGNLLVDATNAEFNNMNETDLQNGQRVKVKGDFDAQNNLLIAAEVKLRERTIAKKYNDIDNRKEEVEMDGVVTRVIDAETLMVNGQIVLINANTELKDIIVADIAIGDRISLEGEVNANNDIIASEIEGKQLSSSELEGVIEVIDSHAQKIMVNGVEIIINATTRLKDDADESDDDERRFFSFANLAVGDKVDISYYTDPVLAINIATKLEREEKESRVEEDQSPENNRDTEAEFDSDEDLSFSKLESNNKSGDRKIAG